MRFPIHIELRRSRQLAFFLLLFHALAVACVISLPWSWPLRSMLLVLIALSIWRTLQPSKITGLRLFAQGHLDCLCAGGEYAAAQVLPDSTVFNQLIVLRVRISDELRVVNLALLADCTSAEQFRVLRLWLRWRGGAGVTETTAGSGESAEKNV